MWLSYKAANLQRKCKENINVFRIIFFRNLSAWRILYTFSFSKTRITRIKSSNILWIVGLERKGQLLSKFSFFIEQFPRPRLMLEIKKKIKKILKKNLKNYFETNSPNVLFLFIYVYSVLKNNRKTIQNKETKNKLRTSFFPIINLYNG